MASAVSKWPKKLVKKLVNYKGDWLRENRGSLMTVAALIVTITFQPAIAPPGGVWQNRTYDPYYSTDQLAHSPNAAHHEETDADCFSRNGKCVAGTAILGYYYWIFKLFIVCDTISFMASLVVLFLLIIGLPRQNNKLSMWFLTITVCISLSTLGFTFVFGMFCVLPDNSKSFLNLGQVELWTIFSWFGFVAIGTLVMVVLVLRPFIKYCVQRFGGEDDDDNINNQTHHQEELQPCSTAAEEP